MIAIILKRYFWILFKPRQTAAEILVKKDIAPSKAILTALLITAVPMFLLFYQLGRAALRIPEIRSLVSQYELFSYALLICFLFLEVAGAFFSWRVTSLFIYYFSRLFNTTATREDILYSTAWVILNPYIHSIFFILETATAEMSSLKIPSSPFSPLFGIIALVWSLIIYIQVFSVTLTLSRLKTCACLTMTLMLPLIALILLVLGIATISNIFLNTAIQA